VQDLIESALKLAKNLARVSFEIHRLPRVHVQCLCNILGMEVCLRIAGNSDAEQKGMREKLIPVFSLR